MSRTPPKPAYMQYYVYQMPANSPVPQTAELRIIFGFATTNEAVVVLHATYTGANPVDQAFANVVDTAVKNAFTSSGYAALVVPQVHLHTTGVRNMADPTQIEFLGNTSPSTPGTAVNATPLPANTSICVSGSTGRRGASYRSRHYLWGWSVAAVAPAGGISDAASAAAVGFMNAVDANLGALPNALHLGVLSRFWRGAQNELPPGTERVQPIMTDIISYSLKDRVFDTQRRRAIPGI